MIYVGGVFEYIIWNVMENKKKKNNNEKLGICETFDAYRIESITIEM